VFFGGSGRQKTDFLPVYYSREHPMICGHFGDAAKQVYIGEFCGFEFSWKIKEFF
jgi:hypothetical protein